MTVGWMPRAVRVALAVLLAWQTPAEAQTRLGISFGGIATVAATVEVWSGSRSIETIVGTWSFRDLSIAVSGKQYAVGKRVRPFVGLGLWAAVARSGGERTGGALVLRAPIGVEWEMVDRNAIGMELGLNRGLWVRRSDPLDDLPLNRRIVPLPAAYYRWQS